MHQTTSDRPCGIQCTMIAHLEDLDFADDLTDVSSKHVHIQEKSERLGHDAKQVDLDINKIKTQVMCIHTPATPQITIEGEALECVEDVRYLGSLMSSNSGAKKDIRLNEARTALSRLRPIWTSKQYSLKTKLSFLKQ